jgi:hypothetical protein
VIPDGAAERDAGPAPDTLPDPWDTLLRGATALHLSGAPEHGVELRHVRRSVQPVADAVMCGAQVVSALASVQPRESAAAHAAHTALAAMCIAGPLGVSRACIADLGVAALLHDTGHAGSCSAERDHALEGVRCVMASTTWSPLSLTVMQVALAHHDAREAPLMVQVVSAADAYVTLLARADAEEPWLSPAGSLARVLGVLSRHWHPAIPTALVRSLGLYPPGQVVQLDDGSFARALAPDPADPARPWIARLVDARGLLVPAWASVASPLPPRRRVVRALPRQEWPQVEQERPAA